MDVRIIAPPPFVFTVSKDMIRCALLAQGTMSTALRTCLIEAMGDEAPTGVIVFAGALILLSAALTILILMML